MSLQANAIAPEALQKGRFLTMSSWALASPGSFWWKRFPNRCHRAISPMHNLLSGSKRSGWPNITCPNYQEGKRARPIYLTVECLTHPGRKRVARRFPKVASSCCFVFSALAGPAWAGPLGGFKSSANPTSRGSFGRSSTSRGRSTTAAQKPRWPACVAAPRPSASRATPRTTS